VQISQSVVVEAPIEDVYGTFADLDRWVDVLPDCLAVEVLYADGYQQEFTMTVDRPAGPETVRGVRYCRAPRELELVQTTPPPKLGRMCGRWRFSERDGRTTVVAQRDFELLDAEASEEAFAAGLGRTLRHNLELFREAIEHDRRD
jgi:ribosome-associated toxin RatA of RatAB toxin-antitoxin module